MYSLPVVERPPTVIRTVPLPWLPPSESVPQVSPGWVTVAVPLLTIDAALLADGRVPPQFMAIDQSP